MNPTIYATWVSVAEEARLAPAYMVGITGCQRRCAFCHARPEWGQSTPDALDSKILQRHFEAAVAARCATLQFTGGEPADHLDQIVAALPEVPPLPITFNTSRPAALVARPHVLERFATVVVSLKFGNAECARRLCGDSDYLEPVRSGLVRLTEMGRPLRVRHLAMPGHVECCLGQTLDWLGEHLPDVPLTLLTGYVPPASSAAPELLRTLTPDEREMILALSAASEVCCEYVGQAIPAKGRAAAGPENIPVVITADGTICLPSVSEGARQLVAGLSAGDREEEP